MSSTIGWIGLGRLGLTCALALAHHGRHQVHGYDLSEAPRRILAGDTAPHEEAGLPDLITANQTGTGHRLTVHDSIRDVLARLDDGSVVFVAVQTPHDPRYGGEQPITDTPRDFEYAYLTQAVRDTARAAADLGKTITLVVISTVLPGTTRAHLTPLCGPNVRLVYGPYFIAMTTTIADFLHPEFVLLGADDTAALDQVADLYGTVHDRPVHRVSIESAELLKVSYNCFISLKIVFANMIMEICHKTGADTDEITAGLALATDRITSPAYLRGGMGDAGGCHPRDNQAMSWLAGTLDLSADLMGAVSHFREQQSAWLADLTEHWHRLTLLPITILGSAYKPNVSLTNGSAGLLLAHQLRDRGLHPQHIDPWVDRRPHRHLAFDQPQVFVIATAHDCFRTAHLPAGSVVLDPHGYMPDTEGVTTIRIGRKQ